MSHAIAAKSALPLVVWILSGALGACSGGGAAGNDAAAGAGGTAGTTATAGATGNGDDVVGTFAIKLATDTPPAITKISGKVSDGPAPAAMGLAVAMKDDTCTLFTPVFPFCSTSCGDGVCIADETCRPYPTAKNVGAVTLSGVKTQAGGTSIALVNTSNNYQPPVETPPAYPPFDEGADVGLSATGGAYGNFEIHAKGIAPLVVTDSDLTVDRDKALALAWTPKGASSDATVHVKLEISHHGGFKGQIECDGADTGALTISAPLVTALVNLGVAGFPTVTVIRTTTASTKIAPGRVQLQLSHGVEREVTVPGLLSCTDTTDCAAGKTCQANLTCK